MLSGKSIPISIYRRDNDWSYMDILIIYFKHPETEA